jgi:phage recombination protein Bet
MSALTLFEGRQLDLIRKTVAKDCDTAEFEQFVHICRAVKLDPLRRQIYCFVFNKHKPEWRQMTVVTAIGGYRAIAERTGAYRPDDRAPRYEYGEKDAKTNPLGIFRCEVTVYKHSHGEWFPVIGEAYWDEYVPLKDGLIDGKKTGWVKMPRIMIAKCAEANALRKAWPDDFAGVEVEEEIDRRTIELSATELADEAAMNKRFEMIGGINAITVDWCNGEPLAREPVGTFGDRVLEFIHVHKLSDPSRVRLFQDRNAEALKEYWARDKSGALALKQEFEATAHLEAAE